MQVTLTFPKPNRFFPDMQVTLAFILRIQEKALKGCTLRGYHLLFMIPC